MKRQRLTSLGHAAPITLLLAACGHYQLSVGAGEPSSDRPTASAQGGGATFGDVDGGVYDPGLDPLPIAPGGVVKTSDSYLVFEWVFEERGAAPTPTQLMFLDLQGNGQAVEVSAPGTLIGERSVSRERAAYLYRAPAPASPANLYLSLFTDSGYVPSALVTGFVGRPAAFGLDYLGFSATSRFALVNHSQPDSVDSSPGFDLIDVARGSRHYSLEGAGALSWAPKGYLFTYNREGPRLYVARVIEGGISEPQPLPEKANIYTHFTPDGRRLFYSVPSHDGVSPISLGLVEPPAAARQFYAGALDAIAPSGDQFVIENGGESVLTKFLVPGDPSHEVVWRIFSDGMRDPVAVSEPSVAQLDALPLLSESGSLVALSSAADDGTWRLELLRATQHFEVAEKTAAESAAFFVGERLVYSIVKEGITEQEIHSASLEGSSVVDTLVARTDQEPIPFCSGSPLYPSPGSRFSYLSRSPAGLHFIDLSVAQPATARHIAPSAQTPFIDSCPICNAAGDTCVYVEHSDYSLPAEHSKVYAVHYGPDGPSEPELIFEADRALKLVVAHLP